ncbi:hypothetical protein F4808DRAFT_190939 [Astrocystis sublimbata]|nr:hypothetical protein F4808DRAFT_190939 [Astrocystis sublimbata]
MLFANLLVPAAFAVVAQAINPINHYPGPDEFLKVGDVFVYEFEPDLTRGDDTFEAIISCNLVDPIVVHEGSGSIFDPPVLDYKGDSETIDPAVKYSSGNVTWNVQPIDGRVGAEWYYRFAFSLSREATEFHPVFHIEN